MDVNLGLLSNLVFGNDIEISERFMKEGGHIAGFLKNLGVGIIVDELEQFIEDSLNLLDFSVIGIY